MNASILTRAAVICAFAFCTVGCGDAVPGLGGSGVPAGGKAPAPGAKPAAAPGKKGPAPAPSDLPPLPQREIGEKDFNPANRDPFKPYVEVGPVIVDRGHDRNVLLGKYALDECKIVGIVTGDAARVLISDPTGLGWVAHVGDFVGKADNVHAGGSTGTDVPVNWRVDRIRPNDVVFVREDPSRPDVQAVTRVLSMRTAEELHPEIRTGVPRQPELPALPGAPGLPPASSGQLPASPPKPSNAKGS